MALGCLDLVEISYVAVFNMKGPRTGSGLCLACFLMLSRLVLTYCVSLKVCQMVTVCQLTHGSSSCRISVEEEYLYMTGS